MWNILKAYESPAPVCLTQRKSLNTYKTPLQGNTAIMLGLWSWDRKVLDSDSQTPVLISRQFAC